MLKILESPDRRLLIADEVGLGKTVEAGLILAELEARQPLGRVLVVCPSRLREKWRDEMSRKFGKDFDIANRTDLEEYLERIRRSSSRSRLRAVVSMQTLRNRDLRERLLSEVGFIDLVIVDEAHHARNPSAQTSEMLRELCEIAGAVLLLTATPLHLGNRDLFTLLQALRPSEFRDYTVFDQRLRRYKEVHEAALLVRSQKEENLARVRQILVDLFQSSVLASPRDPLAVQVIQDLEGTDPEGAERVGRAGEKGPGSPPALFYPNPDEEAGCPGGGCDTPGQAIPVSVDSGRGRGVPEADPRFRKPGLDQ